MGKNTKDQKILLTGGHLTPALAILDELQSQKYSNIVWVGLKYTQAFSAVTSAEYNIIKTKKIRFYSLHAGKIWRKWTKATFIIALINTILVPIGFIEALIIILIERPKLIISFGGYIALPIVLVGHLFKIKSITHEQTITTGVSNKIISKYADRILVSWPDSIKHYPKDKTILTGNPIRQEALTVSTNKFHFNNSLPIIYITGGNQGSNTINWRLYEFLPKLIEQANVIHQTGNSTVTNDFLKAKKIFEHLNPKYQKRYIFSDNFYGPEIGEILHKANLIVSRSGANIVSEIIALNKFALLIPIPWSSQDEQQLNAEFAQKNGNGIVLKQYDEMQPQELYVAILKALDMAQNRKATNNTKFENSIDKIMKVIETLL
jgi:UDP-N-acetylglucosamine--N-acetylmuramyl-(pentapeptide) pyrophosphoryl-undecaprenol N-acetylglucosamine transferase